MKADRIENPFTLSFGKSPTEYISRMEQKEHILNAFNARNPSNQVFMLTGVRGSGKTVLMTDIAGTLKQNAKEWIVLNLNPERDLLQAMAAKLYDHAQMHKIFLKAKIDLSILGIGLSLEGASPISDVEAAIERMLAEVQKQQKRVLVTIDEATNNAYVRVFASSFQIMMREDYPVFLLMTGLYQNIDQLQNEKSLTFLFRAPKIPMVPLDKVAVTDSFANVFQLDLQKAKTLAELTKGYPFAYQVLGYLCWENHCADHPEFVMAEYDQRLSEYVYRKIWSELSEKDREVTEVIADGYTQVRDIMQHTGMSKPAFSQYRNRLMKKGIILSPEWGKLELALPRFEHFVKVMA